MRQRFTRRHWPCCATAWAQPFKNPEEKVSREQRSSRRSTRGTLLAAFSPPTPTSSTRKASHQGRKEIEETYRSTAETKAKPRPYHVERESARPGLRGRPDRGRLSDDPSAAR